MNTVCDTDVLNGLADDTADISQIFAILEFCRALDVVVSDMPLPPTF